MSMTKAIAHKKEHRKEFRGSKVFDKMCRNHGGCQFCQGNRLHHTHVSMERMEAELREWAKNEE